MTSPRRASSPENALTDVTVRDNGSDKTLPCPAPPPPPPPFFGGAEATALLLAEATTAPPPPPPPLALEGAASEIWFALVPLPASTMSTSLPVLRTLRLE